MSQTTQTKVGFPVLSVDFGLKTTGLAWGVNKIALEVLKPIKVNRPEQVLPQILDLIGKLKIKTVVIGRPEQGEVVYWVKKLAGQLTKASTGIKVVLYPETLSSKKAWLSMSRLNYSFKAKKELNDSFAALEILKDFLV